MSEGGPVVTNSGPVIALATVGQLDVLGTLYGSVLVPGAVFRKVTEAGAGRPDALEVVSATWIERVDVDSPPDHLLAEELGASEAEAIERETRQGRIQDSPLQQVYCLRCEREFPWRAIFLQKLYISSSLMILKTHGTP